MSAWEPILFFADEDAEALKAEFIRLSAKHKGAFSAFEIATHVFMNLPEPGMRAMQAASLWQKDLDVQERIRTYGIGGEGDTSAEALKVRLLKIADSETTEAKDKIKALETIASMQGMISRPIEFKDPSGKSNGIPVINIMMRDFDNDPTE